MSCCFEDRLHYDAPSNGDWGICRLGMLVPESVELFVGPSACGRHGALGGMHNGYRDRMAFLYLDQSDIIEGYAHLIPDAVEEFLSVREKRPRVVMMIFTCLDDLIGTDHEALGEELSERFPDIRFRSCHMNPISTDTKTPPMVSIQNNIYSFLEESKEKDKGINTIGNYMALPGDHELRKLLNEEGYGPLRHISDYYSFDDYLKMAGSALNLVLNPLGLQAAERLKNLKNMPYRFLPVSYDIKEVDEQMEEIGEILSIKEIKKKLIMERDKAENAIMRARDIVGEMPVIVDDSSTAQPFGLAKALLTYGFKVKHIEAQLCAPYDKEHLTWIEDQHSEVTFSQPQNDTAVLYDHIDENALSIGAQGAYFAKTKHIVDQFGDLEMFGYNGITRMMNKMIEAAEKKSDLKEILNKMGLVV